MESICKEAVHELIFWQFAAIICNKFVNGNDLVPGDGAHEVQREVFDKVRHRVGEKAQSDVERPSVSCQDGHVVSEKK